MADFLGKVMDQEGLDIILAQECTDTQAANICNDLGGHWAFSGGGDNSNCVLLYDGLAMEPVPGTLKQLTIRPGCTIQQLRHLSTGEPCWYVAAHLASGSTNAILRASQIRVIGGVIDNLLDNTEVIVGADLNDPTSEGSLGSVRKIASREFELRCVRRALELDMIRGESVDSSHQWDSAGCDSTWRWIDDVFVRPGARMVRARLFHTCRDVWNIPPTDHNGIWAKVIY